MVEKENDAPVDYGGGENPYFSKSELKTMKEESERKALIKEAEDAKREHTLKMKTKRFFEATGEKAKGLTEGFKAGKQEVATGKEEQVPQYLPAKEKQYYAPTKNISRKLFGIFKTAKEDIGTAKREFGAVKKELGGLAKEAKGVEKEVGGFFTPEHKAERKSDYFSAGGTMFEHEAKRSPSGKSDFMDKSGTMFGPDKPVRAKVSRKHRKHRKRPGHKVHKRQSGAITITINRGLMGTPVKASSKKLKRRSRA
jgi:hypothetical protein